MFGNKKKIILSALVAIMSYMSIAQAFAQDRYADNLSAVRARAQSAFDELDKESAGKPDDWAERKFEEVRKEFEVTNKQLLKSKEEGVKKTAAEINSAIAGKRGEEAAKAINKLNPEKRIEKVIEVKSVNIQDPILMTELGQIGWQVGMGQKIKFKGEKIDAVIDGKNNLVVKYKGAVIIIPAKQIEGIQRINNMNLKQNTIRLRIIQEMIAQDLIN